MSKSRDSAQTQTGLEALMGRFAAQTISAVTDIVILLDQAGTICEIARSDKEAASSRLSPHIGASALTLFSEESQEKLSHRLHELSSGAERQSVPPRIELNHAHPDIMPRAAAYRLAATPDGDGVLMLGQLLPETGAPPAYPLEDPFALTGADRDTGMSRAIYRAVLTSVDHPVVIIFANKGQIADLNAKAARLLGGSISALRGASFSDQIGSPASALRPIKSFLEQYNLGAERSFDVRLSGTDRSVRLRLSKRMTQTPDVAICLIDPLPEDNLPSDWTRRQIDTMFRQAPNPCAITDKTGHVMECNARFLELVALPAVEEIAGSAISDIFVDGQSFWKKFQQRPPGTTEPSHYHLEANAGLDQRLHVRVSAQKIDDAGKQGYVFHLTPLGANPSLPAAAPPDQEPGTSNAISLIGKATLKEIVAETTDVIEKMCIEAALELTNDNRAATAELLGMSRQKLYSRIAQHGIHASKNNPRGKIRLP